MTGFIEPGTRTTAPFTLTNTGYGIPPEKPPEVKMSFRRDEVLACYWPIPVRPRSGRPLVRAVRMRRPIIRPWLM